MSENETIECSVDKTWFCWKRWVPITVMCVAFGAYFLYDGLIGYPKNNEIRKAYDLYVEEHGGSDDGWDKYASEKGWPGREDIPKLTDAQREAGQTEPHPQEDIDGQFHWAYACFALAAAALINILMKVGRKLKADGEAFYTPTGTKVPYSAIYKLDKRKWDNKGLATVYYNEGAQQKKATLDVLMFPRAEEVISLVQKNLKGELIEMVDDVDENEGEEDGKSSILSEDAGGNSTDSADEGTTQDAAKSAETSPEKP